MNFESNVKPRDALAEVSDGGKFVRTAAGFREFISPQHEVFKPEAGRYSLYVSMACPWANRAVAMLKLKGLTDIIGITVTHPTWQRSRPDSLTDTHKGWAFFDSSKDAPLSNPAGYGSFSITGCEPDIINGAKFIRDLYEISHDTTGKYSVPVLWDKQTGQIVNNESSEIMRMFNTQFSEFEKGPFAGHDFYPLVLQAEIDELNTWIYSGINDGVYKCGFAKSQIAYDEAINKLFTSLDRVESILSTSRYLAGGYLTEADIRLFMTLVRFDEVYVVYFKTNVRFLTSYENIRQYMREMYQLPGMNEAIRMDHIKMHYFTSHPELNAYAIIPKGPNAIGDMMLPHNRNELFPIKAAKK